MARRLIGTAVTDSNGEATITYTGTGAGKLNVVAESGTFVSETYSLEDCDFYDDASTDKSSDYTVRTSKTSTLTHNTSYYTMTGATGGSGVGMMIGRSPTSISTSNNWIFEADINSGSSSQWKSISLLLDSTHMVSFIVYSNGTFLAYDYGASAEITRASFSSYSASNYYRVKVKLENNALTMGLYNTSDTLLCSMTGTLPSAYQSKTVYPCITQFANDSNNTSINFKNVKVKPL